MTPTEQLKEQIKDLEQKLLSAHPQIPTILRTIHQGLKADPDVCTLLSEDEIAIVVSGLKKQTNVEITAAMMKGTGKKAMKNMSVSDL